MTIFTAILVFSLLFCLLFCLLVLRAQRNSLRKVRAELEENQHKVAEVESFLHLFSKSLSSIDEIGRSMDITARYVGELVGAQSVCIFRKDGDFLQPVGISGAFPNLERPSGFSLARPRYVLDVLKRQKIRIGEGIVGQVAMSRIPLFLPDASDDSRFAELSGATPVDTMMAFPMIFNTRLLGVICAVNAANGKPFSTSQFEKMKFITNQVVLAHNFVQIYTTLSEQQRINQELYFTRQLQSSLIPKKFPVWDQFVVHSFTRSAKEVNGDFYDFVEIDEDRLLLVVGDASGKGIPACMMMAMTRSFIRANIGRFTTLENLLFELNSNLYRDTDDERYITLAFCLMDRKRSTIDYARAGHTPLILFRDSAIHTIFPDGSALGLVPNELTHFDILSFEFRRDTTLLIFSDGISEALNDHDEEYGLSNLCKVFENACRNQMAPDAIIGKVLQDVDAFADPARGQTDDQTMVIVKHL